MHRDLRSFLQTLRNENEIVEISAEVDPYLELAEIHRRIIDERGKALLFTNVKGSRFPVVTNLFGTVRRIELAFGKRPLQFVHRAVEMVEKIIPPKPKTLWDFRDECLDSCVVYFLARIASRHSLSRACITASSKHEHKHALRSLGTYGVGHALLVRQEKLAESSGWKSRRGRS